MSTPTLVEPAARAPTVDKADYVEYQALISADGNFSFADYVADIRRSGSMETFDEGDPDSAESLVDSGGEESELLADEVYLELADREASCDKAYPFSLNANFIEIAGREPSVYLFMLLLSLFGNAGIKADEESKEVDVTKLFEEMCGLAAVSYFGGPSTAQLFPFGAPRRGAPSGFAAAVDELCKRLNEGGGIRQQGNLRDQKDGKLDLVVWRNFPDGRSGQMIGFGQCATGKDWKGKVSELRPDAFCKTWMRDMPAVTPVGLFFVPFRLSIAAWQSITNNGGIVFDRCRIAHHLASAPPELVLRCETWCKSVLAEQAVL